MGAASILAALFLFQQSLEAPRPEANQTEASQKSNSQLREPEGQPGGKELPIRGTVVRTARPEAVEAFARSRGLTAEKRVDLPGGEALITLSEPEFADPVQELKRQPFVSSVSTNYVYRALDTPTDPNYSAQWNLPKVSGPQAWDITTGTSSTVVAVIDTGVLFSQSWGTLGPFTQPDFPVTRRWENTGEGGEGCTPTPSCSDKKTNGVDDDGNGKIDDWQGWDFMGGWRGGSDCPNGSSGGYTAEDNDPQPYSCDNPQTGKNHLLNKDHFNGTCSYSSGACFVGHGTMVASVIAAETNNGQLIAGIDRAAKVMNLRVLDGYGFGETAFIVAAVEYATAEGAHVINMSLGILPNFVDTALENAMAAAKAAGIVIVAASGNDGTEGVYYPGSSVHAIGVGATDQNDNRASFSSYGSELDVVAPGQGIPVANAPSAFINSNYYASADGTSLATPHVAGMAALIKAVRPSLTAEQVRSEIIAAVNRPSGMGGASFTKQYGFGRINLLKAAIGTLRWSRVSQTSSTGSFSLKSGESATITLTVKNEGSATWSNSGNYPVRLATSNPKDRASSFYDSSWISTTRPVVLQEASVAPGANGTFVFTVRAPGPAGTYNEYFSLVAEGHDWFVDPVNVMGFTVTNPYAWDLLEISHSRGTALMGVGDIQTVTVKARNTGSVTWEKAGANPVRLGVWSSSGATSHSSWISARRPATFQEASVAPGADATFSFTVQTPQLGEFTETIGIVAENLIWAPYNGAWYYLRAIPNYRWELSSVSHSLGTARMNVGETQIVTIRAKNIGGSIWTNTGDFPVRIGTWLPGRVAPTRDLSWLAPDRPVTLQEASVGHGEVGTFVFTVKAPLPGEYLERVNLVAENKSWFNDIGAWYYIRSDNPYAWELVSVSHSKGTALMSVGETQTVTIKAKNTGTVTWVKDGANPVRLGIYGSSGATADPSWLTPIRPDTFTDASVAPGAVGTFDFLVKAPYVGEFLERVNIVAENLIWAPYNGAWYYIRAE